MSVVRTKERLRARTAEPDVAALLGMPRGAPILEIRRIAQAGLRASILRPWYVLGPGHRWPVVLLPFYWLARQMRSTRPAALRLGLVNHSEMVAALTSAIENPPSPDGSGGRVWGPVEIRAIAAEADSAAARSAPGR